MTSPIISSTTHMALLVESSTDISNIVSRLRHGEEKRFTFTSWF